MWRRRAQKRGQSLVELAILLPVLLLLFVGAYTASNFLNDRQIAGQATRAGARLGAEIGNANYLSGQAAQAGSCQTTGNDPCIIDQEIVTSTITVARNLTNVSSMNEIDIYSPCTTSGSSCSSTTSTCPATNTSDGSYLSGDWVDIYKPNGSGVWVLNGSAQYTLDRRKQVHPNEASIGVRLVYTFQGSAPMTFFNMQTSEYATMCMAPIQSGG
jgi:Flp pilus assembly protein TadG